MTMLYFKYKAQDRSLSYSSAGHEHILVYRSKTKEVESITSGGFMLGMLPDIDSYLEDSSISLLHHDKVLLYTDGVTEAENTQGERFGLERLKESFKANSSKAPEELIQTIKTEVYEFIGTQPQYDDITLVGMEAK